MKKVSKRVSPDQQAYPAHGKKAPRPGQTQMQDPGPSHELKPTKGKQPVQGSKKIEQASKETASMSVGQSMGQKPSKMDSRASAAQSSSQLDVKGPNQGESLDMSQYCSHKKDSKGY